MKIAFIKSEKDEENYIIPKVFGMTLSQIKKPEEIDNKIEEFRKQKYNAIVITNELASFSEKIINRYKYDESIKIIITPNKNKNK